MPNRNSVFFSMSKTVAENFLHTVIVVDDQAFFEKPDLPNEPAAGQLVMPTSHSRTDGDDYQLQAPPDNEVPNGPSHLLDAKSVIDSFAQKGIVCSILKPEKQDSDMLVTTLPKLATCADIIILDWDLNKDKGQAVLHLIGNIVTNNNETPYQLRLIVIYTGEPNIGDVSEKIRSHLTNNGNLIESADENNLSFHTRSVRVVIFAKPQTGVAPHLVSHRIEFSRLVDTVTEEFALMTSGLVLNVVLESLTQIRRNTHKLLAKLSSQLDPPYLTHRAFQDDPRDAEDHLTFLIAEEIQAILDESKVSEKANFAMITDWFADKGFSPPSGEEFLSTKFAEKLKGIIANNETDFQGKLQKIRNLTQGQIPISSNLSEELNIILQSGEQEEARLNSIKTWLEAKRVPPLLEPFLQLQEKDLLELLEIGIDEWKYLNGKQKEKGVHKYPFTKLFCLNQTDAKYPDEKFAISTTMRSFYGHEERRLTLGTIIKQESTENISYWICIQPKCDTYRIPTPRAFPFLPMSLVKGEGKFDLIVEESGEYNKLLLSKKPYDIKLITFKPNDSQTVTTQNRFYMDINENKFLWVGELRAEHAQRLSHRFATEVSRVGVNESQWLRRWSSKD